MKISGKLLHLAKERLDYPILDAIGPEGDCVAREVQYHKTCFRIYTKSNQQMSMCNVR